jgi:hypothetical protein
MEETKQEAVNEKSIVDKIFAEIKTYTSANKLSREEFESIHKAYKGVKDDPKDVSKSQESTNSMSTEVSYIVPAIFSGNPELEVSIEGDEDKDLAYACQKIVNHDIENIPQAYEIIEAWVKQAVVYGTSILWVVWKFLTKKNEDNTETPVADEPSLIVPHILDSYYNPIIPNVEDQSSMPRRSVQSIESVKNNPAYDFVGANGLNRERVESKSITANQENSSSQSGADFDLKSASDGTVEVYEKVSKDRIQTVVDGKEQLLLRDVENPYGFIYAVKLIYEPKDIPNYFEGDGVGHNTLGLGKLSEKMLNRSLDNVALTNNAFFLFAKGTKIDKRQLVVKPGGGVEVDAGNKTLAEVIQPIQFPDIKQGAVLLQDKIDDKHKRASGANDLVQGAASNKTLGQDQISSSFSSSRFELVTRRFKQALADVGRMILIMRIKNLQSIDDAILKIFPLEAEITDQGEIKYSRETVYQMLIAARDRDDLKFNIKVKGNTNQAKNKQYQLQEFNKWLEMFLPELPPKNKMACGKKWLELAGIDEIGELMPDPETFAQEQMQVDPMTGQPIDPQMMTGGMQPQMQQPMM